MLAEEQGLRVEDGQQLIPAAVRPLGWHVPDGQRRTVRRGLVTFAYEFAGIEPVDMQLHTTAGAAAHRSWPAQSAPLPREPAQGE